MRVVGPSNETDHLVRIEASTTSSMRRRNPLAATAGVAESPWPGSRLSNPLECVGAFLE
jgi:hypothetical protein